MFKFLKICKKNNEAHELKNWQILKRNNTNELGKTNSKNARITTKKQQKKKQKTKQQ